MRQGRDGRWRAGCGTRDPFPGGAVMAPRGTSSIRGGSYLVRGDLGASRDCLGEGFGGRRRGLGSRWEKPELVDVMGFSELEELPLPYSALFLLSG